MPRDVILQDLGIIDYKKAWDYQEQLFKSTVDLKIAIRKNETREKTKNHLLFCEHPHVFTLGKSGDIHNLLLIENQLSEINAVFYKVNRGGDITYHGPGQIVMYPIFDLSEYFFTDIHKYIRLLEESVILTLEEYDIKAGRSKGKTGVWLDPEKENERKICAIGVRASRWVTMHGIAFNVNTDLDYFNYIIPCGIQNKGVTSIEKELNHKVDIKEVKAKLKQNLKSIFEIAYIEAQTITLEQ